CRHAQPISVEDGVELFNHDGEHAVSVGNAEGQQAGCLEREQSIGEFLGIEGNEGRHGGHGYGSEFQVEDTEGDEGVEVTSEKQGGCDEVDDFESEPNDEQAKDEGTDAG